MQQLIKIDKKTGRKFVINVPSWDDYLINPNANAIDSSDSDDGEGTDAGGSSGFATTPISLATGLSGSVYFTQQILAVGGIPPYTYSISSGNLPTGITMNTSGSISGTPSVTGSYPFIIQITDSTGAQGNVSYTLFVCSVISILPTSLANPTGSGSIGTYYSSTFTSNGGKSPYTYSIISGSVPPGLSLNSGGSLSGTPTQSGSYTFVLMSNDSSGCSISSSYSQFITPPIYVGSNFTNTNYNGTYFQSGSYSGFPLFKKIAINDVRYLFYVNDVSDSFFGYCLGTTLVTNVFDPSVTYIGGSFNLDFSGRNFPSGSFISGSNFGLDTGTINYMDAYAGFIGVGFGNPSYNSEYYPGSTHSGNYPYFINSIGYVLYKSTNNGLYTLSSSFDDTVTHGDYQISSSAPNKIEGIYSVTKGTAPSGSIQAYNSSNKLNVTCNSSTTYSFSNNLYLNVPCSTICSALNSLAVGSIMIGTPSSGSSDITFNSCLGFNPPNKQDGGSGIFIMNGKTFAYNYGSTQAAGSSWYTINFYDVIRIS